MRAAGGRGPAPPPLADRAVRRYVLVEADKAVLPARSGRPDEKEIKPGLVIPSSSLVAADRCVGQAGLGYTQFILQKR
ncbi:MAG: hypothetical protein Q8O86_00050 [Dehalococcoidia bacterium]|nr:hypothetical protein [Dehalococcoidia bacterium]